MERASEAAAVRADSLWSKYLGSHKNPAPYVAALRDWGRFVGAAGDVEALRSLASASVEAAFDYVAWGRRQRGIRERDKITYRTAATINQRIHFFRKFGRLLCAAGVAARNVWDAVTPCREKRVARSAAAIPAAAVATMLARCDCRHPAGTQEKALLSLAIGAALRRSEVVRLKIRDVLLRDGACCVRLLGTKNGEDILQPLSPEVAAAVAGWLTHSQYADAQPDDPLFCKVYHSGQRKNSPLGQSTVARIVKRAAARAGLDSRRIGAHSCRATGVTLLLEQGIERKDVLEFGRFHSYRMLDVYDKRARGIEHHAGLKLKL